MFDSQDLHQKILLAIDASEKIIASLQRNDFEQAEKYEAMRAGCVRALSKCQNFEVMAMPHLNSLERLAELDKTILLSSRKLHDEVLTQIRQEQTNRLRHVQYVENQRL
ncbi:MAG: hypothetical protein AB8B89_08740 [Gammaproteobacteria bacterium]